MTYVSSPLTLLSLPACQGGFGGRSASNKTKPVAGSKVCSTSHNALKHEQSAGTWAKCPECLSAYVADCWRTATRSRSLSTTTRNIP